MELFLEDRLEAVFDPDLEDWPPILEPEALTDGGLYIVDFTGPGLVAGSFAEEAFAFVEPDFAETVFVFVEPDFVLELFGLAFDAGFLSELFLTVEEDAAPNAADRTTANVAMRTGTRKQSV